jgi:hypothetical protein
MGFEERSYNSHLFRPRPEVHVERDESLIIVATPWGSRPAARKAIQIIQDYYLSSRQDNEATSPFAKLTCLSPMANHLRIAVKLANDAIYHEDNKREFVSAIELFVLARSHNEIVWTQIGQPFALLDRPQRPLTPLGNFQDLSVEFSTQARALAPLPHRLLGLDNSSDFSIESFRPHYQDRLVLLSRSGLAPSIFQLSPADRNLKYITELLSQDDVDLPFWAAIFSL